MSKAIALSRKFQRTSEQNADLLSGVIVLSAAAALILAGQPLPF